MTKPPKPQIGVSACLMGQKVRYDGGHKRFVFLTDVLKDYMDFVTICPETAIGLGVPRPPIRLVGEADKPQALGVDDPSLNVTRKLEDYARKEAAQSHHLSGYILKKDSPSCGMERVKVYTPSGHNAVRKGAGIFAHRLMQELPLLPVEEEGRLNDAVLRENFINRVFVYQRWQLMLEKEVAAKDLIKFHSDHKYMVMAHSQAAYQRMGRMLSDLSGSKVNSVKDDYIHELMTALKRRVSRKRHVNVLQHIMGYFKKAIDKDDKDELTKSIEAYRREETPLVVPVTLLKHYLRRHPDPYMERQTYLNPYPDSLGLRNNI